MRSRLAGTVVPYLSAKLVFGSDWVMLAEGLLTVLPEAAQTVVERRAVRNGDLGLSSSCQPNLQRVYSWEALCE
jgi:hypothetical protein